MDCKAIIVVITAIAAICGASTGVINLWKSRRHLRITLLNASNPSEISFIITVANPGRRTVTIKNTPRIKPLKGKYIFTVPNPGSLWFPYEMKEGGKPLLFRVQKGELATKFVSNGYSGKVKLSTEVTDTLDNIYKSKKAFKFDLDEWAE